MRQNIWGIKTTELKPSSNFILSECRFYFALALTRPYAATCRSQKNSLEVHSRGGRTWTSRLALPDWRKDPFKSSLLNNLFIEMQTEIRMRIPIGGMMQSTFLDHPFERRGCRVERFELCIFSIRGLVVWFCKWHGCQLHYRREICCRGVP